MLTPKEMAEYAVGALDDKKAQDVKLLHTTDVTILADYFIICTATSTTHLKTLSDEVEKQLKKNGQLPRRREGSRTGGWILLDFACVIVHIFLKETREFYTLERLWGDAEDEDINNIITESGVKSQQLGVRSQKLEVVN